MIRMLNADPSVVSNRAKKRGLPQLGTLGAGNHYAEIQVVTLAFYFVQMSGWILSSNLHTGAIFRLLMRYTINLQPARWELRKLVRYGECHNLDFQTFFLSGGANDSLWL